MLPFRCHSSINRQHDVLCWRVWAVHQLQAQASTTRLDKQETTACTDTDPASAYLTGSGWAPPGA